MDGKWLRKRVGFILIFLFCFSVFVFGQDEPDKQLRAEILSIYKSKGEQGLRDFVRKQKDKVSNTFIVDFAKAGKNDRKEEWLKVCEIIAEEENDEKTLADVLYETGEYFRLISDYKKAANHFEKAFPIYLKFNDPVGQGNVYLRKGFIYFYTGDNFKALEMCDKALPFFEKAGDSIGQGDIYSIKGLIYSSTGNIAEALEMIDKALFFYEKVGNLLGQGNVCWSKGDIYFKIGDNSRALEMYDKALPFFEKSEDPRGQGNVYRSKGDIYFYTGDNSKALEMYDKALPFFEAARELLGQGNVYQSKGDIYFYMGDNLKALEMLDKSLIFLEKAGEPVGQGNVYLSKGKVYFYTGNNSKALEMFDKSLTFFEKVGEPVGQGNVYQNEGDIYFYTGDNSKALEMYDKALSFFEKVGEPVGQGNVYQSKGIIYFYTGDNSKALEMYDKALSFFEKVEEPLGQGNNYMGKGTIYLRIGDDSKALEMCEKALPFFRMANEPRNQGNAYQRMGTIYSTNGDNSKSLEMYDQALSFYKKAEEPIGQGTVYINKGDIFSETGNHSKALELYDRSLVFFEEAGTPFGLGIAYLSKGDLYLQTGDNSRALGMYNKALPLFEKTGVIVSEFHALHGKAKVLVKLGKKDEAQKHFEKGIAYLEKVRTQTAFSEMKRTFMETVYKQYEETVLFMVENRYHEKGFKYAESMKSRVFLDRMKEGLVKLDKGLAPDMKKQHDELTARLSSLKSQIYETAGGMDEEKLKEQYRKAENEFEELLIKIRINHQPYASVKYPEPISVQALQKEVLKNDEILLRYFIAPEKLYVFLVSKNDFKVVPLDIDKKNLDGLISRYFTVLKENDARLLKKYGKQLYNALIQPLEKIIKKNQTIIIVPDGKLATIPFESFIVDNKEAGKPLYLFEKYRVKYIQSASVLSLLRTYYQRHSAASRFIGFGDPVYDYENFKQSKPEQGTLTRSSGEENSIENEIKGIHRDRYARAGGIMNRLPQSGEEIQTIARLFEKESLESVIHLREQASETNAKAANMKDFAYIHFSCHGLLNDDFQSLVLSQLPPDRSSEDGYFTLNEIMNCEYNAKLVVLSACETGKGKMYKGEGVTGLTRAVMYAGTPAVVASLWKVDDRATKELMVRFYQNILEKDMDKVEALRQAKLELLKTQTFSSPYFWSAFVLYGE